MADLPEMEKAQPHPIREARAQLHRGSIHLAALTKAITTYKNNPVPIIDVGRPHEDHPRFGHCHRVTFEIKRPPMAMSLILGDFLNNCQSSLDYLAWNLSAEPASNRQVGFPVATRDPFRVKPTDGLWARLRRKRNHPEWAYWTRKTRGMGTQAVNLVAAVQPYQPAQKVRYQSHPDPLFDLRELNNPHKHRSLTVISTKGSRSRPRVAVQRAQTPAKPDSDGHFSIPIQMRSFSGHTIPQMHMITPLPPDCPMLIADELIGPQSEILVRYDSKAPIEVVVGGRENTSLAAQCAEIAVRVGEIVDEFAECWEEIAPPGSEWRPHTMS